MGAELAAAPTVRRTARKAQKTQLYVSPEASGKVLPFGRLVPHKDWAKQEEADLIRIVEQEGFGNWKAKAHQLGTGRHPDEVRAKAKAIRTDKDKEFSGGLLPVGTVVEALYHHGKPHEYSAWFRAEIRKVDKQGETYVIDWEDGDKQLRVQPANNVRPLPWGTIPLVNSDDAATRRTVAKLQQQQQMETAGDEHYKKSTGAVEGLTEAKRKSYEAKGLWSATGAQSEQVAASSVGGTKRADENMETEGDSIGDSVEEEVAGGNPRTRHASAKCGDAKDSSPPAAVAAEDEEDEAIGGGGDHEESRDGEDRKRIAWSPNEQNQLRKMLYAGRKDWKAMGACIGQGRTESATKQHAQQLQRLDDLKIDKRPVKYTGWGVMSQPIDQEGGVHWKNHCCIDAAILERWGGANRIRSYPTQSEIQADPSLCIETKRAGILKCCTSGTARQRLCS